LRELPEHVLLVIDEAYVEFPDADDFVSALELRELRENMLVLRTFSKAFGLAALRVGYAVGTARAVGLVDRVRAPYNVSSLAISAALAALDDLAHVDRYVQLARAERPRVTTALERMGLRVAPSQANFLLVDVGGDGRRVAEQLQRKGVMVRATPAPIASCVRVTIGLPQDNDRMLTALTAVLGR
jgi:histidinol-phosphate aminotransferase